MEVGQRVWYIAQRGYTKPAPGREYLVVKIARKWITLAETKECHEFNNIRVDRDQIDAAQRGYHARDTRGDVVGTVYVDRQHESYVKDCADAWSKIEHYVRHLTYPPMHVTLKDIKNIALILEVNLDEPTGDTR